MNSKALFLAGLLSILTMPPSTAAEIVLADGRRETVVEPRRDSKGRWTAVRDGRRVVLKPGEVVAVIDDAGRETELIPDLVDGADPASITAALARLFDPKNPTWFQDAETLANRRSRGVLDAAGKLAEHADAELRGRAVHVLIRMGTREGAALAARVAVAEKDLGARREMASALHAGRALLERSKTDEILKPGLEDADKSVRVTFAILLGERGGDAGLAVLRKDGVKHSDHHFREAAAEALAQRGDASGERILIGMLERKKLPGFDGGDELMTTYLVAEQVRVARWLGGLATKGAIAALRHAAKSSPHPAVREAATQALAIADQPSSK